MQHTRIRLDNPQTGEEIRLEGGLSSFPDHPWRVKVTTGIGDKRTTIAEHQYESEEKLFRFIDSYIKNQISKGYRIDHYKVDELDIDWLSGIGLNDEHTR